MSTASRCFLCGESFSVLRSSTKCDRCQKVACTSCCRPSPLDPRRRFCASCVRQQSKADDVNDDRPKWLREAQAARQSAPMGVSHSADRSAVPKPTAQKDDPNDDRPKWLQDAHAQRSAGRAGGKESGEAALRSASSEASSRSVADEIEERLAKLKEESVLIKPVLGEDALHDRLSKLKDQPPGSVSRQPDYSVLKPPVRRTEMEEIESLITEMKEKANLEENDNDLIEELENRLTRLKAETQTLGISGSASPYLSSRTGSTKGKNSLGLGAMDVDDSDEEAEKIARHLSSLPDNDDDEEDKFCVICPNEPTVVCVDCDKELSLYCARCFRESHHEWCLTDHRSRPLKRT